MHGGMHEKTAHKNGPSHKTARQGRAEQAPQPDLCKIYEILTIFMAKKLCLWYPDITGQAEPQLPEWVT